MDARDAEDEESMLMPVDDQHLRQVQMIHSKNSTVLLPDLALIQHEE